MVETRFDCPPDIKSQFIKMCAEREETPGAMMRQLMKTELKRWNERKAKKDEVPDEQLLASLRLRVAKAWKPATSWVELIENLEQDELTLKPAGGGLAICSKSSGQRLAKASDVGPGYLQMIRRFGAGFPGHPQKHLPERVLLNH